MDKEILKKIEEIIKPVIETRGLELIDLEYANSNEGNILRVYIDKDGGVTLKDCEDVSIVLSSILDTYDFIDQHYFLEVSSPGIYRELKKEKDFIRYRNYRIKVKLYQPLMQLKGQKVIIGILKDYRDGFLTILLDDNSEISLDLKTIAKVNLEPNISDVLNKKVSGR
ncbi:MAG: ribosome maturation factor RimP [Endomicrobiia bacterium]